MKLYAIFLLSIALVSCSSEGTGANCYKEYWNGEVGACLPKNWQVISSETMQERGVSNDAIVAFQSEEPVSGQFLTVGITQEVLREVIDPTMYSQANIRLVSALPGYELTDITSTTVDGSAVELHVFNAQPVSDEPVRKFYQISTVANAKGYSITGTSPVSISDSAQNEIIAIVQSLRFSSAVTGAEETSE
jgi:hypothetical protein